MRLINADALRDALQYEIDKGSPPFDDTVGAVRCGIRLARNIAEDQPTVDAVPVEFIEKHVQIAKECDDPIASYHMDWIVAQWRIENGQTD